MDRTTEYLNNLPKVLDVNGGKHAVPPSKVIIENAIKFIKSVPSYYERVLNLSECVTATPTGNISIDWYHKKCFFSVEIGETHLGYYSDLPNGSSPSSDGTPITEIPPASMVKALQVLYDRTTST